MDFSHAYVSNSGMFPEGREKRKEEVAIMGRKQNKAFLGAAGLSLAALMAMAATGCSAPQQQDPEAGGASTTIVVEENQQTGTGDSRTLDEELASPEPLVVSDYGWFVSENNMADLAVEVSNPNEHVSADDVVLTVQGTDSNGQEMFSQDIDLPQIAPDSELVFSYVVGDANSSDAPTDVNVSVNVSDGGWSAYDESERVEYDVSDVTEGSSDIDGVAKFSGNVSAKGSDVENPDGQAVEGQALVNVVLYDGSGKMLGGYFDIVDMDGQDKVPFEIYAVGAPEYQDYQVFVSPYVFSSVQEQDVSQ